MRLLFRQRFFSWFDSYDIYDERENPVYTVKGQLSWGHCLKIFNRDDRSLMRPADWRLRFPRNYFT